MAKIKSSVDNVEDNDDSGIETYYGSDETESLDLDREMKKWLCKRLELLCRRLIIDNRESMYERRQRRKIGRVVAWTAGIVPLVALGTLFYVMWRHPAYFFLMDAVPQAVLISASFLSMVVIYSFLIKGMFQSTQENDENSVPPTVEETVKLMRSLGGKE